MKTQVQAEFELVDAARAEARLALKCTGEWLSYLAAFESAFEVDPAPFGRPHVEETSFGNDRSIGLHERDKFIVHAADGYGALCGNKGGWTLRFYPGDTRFNISDITCLECVRRSITTRQVRQTQRSMAATSES